MAGWLSVTLGHDIGEKFQTIAVNVDYANDLVDAIGTICKGKADSQAGWRAWTDFKNCQRHQYPTWELIFMLYAQSRVTRNVTDLGFILANLSSLYFTLLRPTFLLALHSKWSNTKRQIQDDG